MDLLLDVGLLLFLNVSNILKNGGYTAQLTGHELGHCVGLRHQNPQFDDYQGLIDLVGFNAMIKIPVTILWDITYAIIFPLCK